MEQLQSTTYSSTVHWQYRISFQSITDVAAMGTEEKVKTEDMGLKQKSVAQVKEETMSGGEKVVDMNSEDVNMKTESGVCVAKKKSVQRKWKHKKTQTPQRKKLG